MARARPKQQTFNSGVLDAKLVGREDLDQHYAGLVAGDNMLLLPQGGARRRPCTWFLGEATGPFKLGGFQFNRDQQYVYQLTEARLHVFEDGVRITSLTTPWSLAHVADLGWDSALDTTVFTHQDFAPRQLLRGQLGVNPLHTTNGSATAVVDHANHRADTGDHVGLSGLAAHGGLTAEQINQGFTITKMTGLLAANPVTTTIGLKTVRVAITGNTFAVGERVTFEGLDSTGGVPASEINGAQRVTVTNAAWVEFEQSVPATSSVPSGGGISGSYSAPDKYRITLPGLATATGAGGGTGGRGWVLNVAPLEHIPDFDFDDELSPAATNERQLLTYENFAEDDKHRLVLGSDETWKIHYSASDADLNVQRLTDAIRAMPWTGGSKRPVGTIGSSRVMQAPTVMKYQGVIVSHHSGSPGSAADTYQIDYTADEGGRDWPQLDYIITESNNGTITVETELDGGKTLEPVWSETRGWPRRCAFHGQRLHFLGSKSRPGTRWGSKIAGYFDFDAGDAFDAEGLNDTIAQGAQKVLQAVAADRLFILNEQGEFAEFGGQDGTITPTNVSLKEQSDYGSLNIRPAKLGGSIFYADRLGAGIRELAYSDEQQKYVSPNVALISQHLINRPVDMCVFRTRDGDYLAVANTDGTVACLSRNAEQGVSGWTPLSWDGGQIFAMAVAGDWLYLGVQRTIDGTDRYYMERMLDSSIEYVDENFLDCAIALTGPATEWSGLDHLEGLEVHLLGDGVWIGTAIVAGGAVATVDEFDELVVGIFTAPLLEPVPGNVSGRDGGPTASRKMRIAEALLELENSAGVYVNDYPIRDRTMGDAALQDPPPLLNGLYTVTTRGWARRKTATITQRQPGPMTVLSWEPQVEAN